MVVELTRPLPQTSKPPIGAKMTPMMNKVGRTVFGVRIGCHALRRCCLKAVSREMSAQLIQQRKHYLLAGLLQPPFSFFVSGETSDSFAKLSLFLALRLKRGILVKVVLWMIQVAVSSLRRLLEGHCTADLIN